MTLTGFLLAGLLLAGFINLACSIMILRDLTAAGFKVGYYELRWQLHKHLKTYRQLIRDRNGRLDAYYGYLVSLALLLGFTLLLLGQLLEWS